MALAVVVKNRKIRARLRQERSLGRPDPVPVLGVTRITAEGSDLA